MSPIDKLLAAISEHILNPLLYLAFAVAVLWFLWGGFQYIWTDAAESKSAGKLNMMWGIIGLLIMILAVVIVQVIGNTIQQPIP